MVCGMRDLHIDCPHLAKGASVMGVLLCVLGEDFAIYTITFKGDETSVKGYRNDTDSGFYLQFKHHHPLKHAQPVAAPYS